MATLIRITEPWLINKLSENPELFGSCSHATSFVIVITLFSEIYQSLFIFARNYELVRFAVRHNNLHRSNVQSCSGRSNCCDYEKKLANSGSTK